MAVGLTRLIITYFHSNSSSIITSKITTKVIQENCRRAQLVRSHQYQVGEEAQVSVLSFKKEEAIKKKMRFADLMTEVSCTKQKKLQELATEELKVKMEIE